jgi:hypothetical protein
MMLCAALHTQADEGICELREKQAGILGLVLEQQLIIVKWSILASA